MLWIAWIEGAVLGWFGARALDIQGDARFACAVYGGLLAPVVFWGLRKLMPRLLHTLVLWVTAAGGILGGTWVGHYAWQEDPERWYWAPLAALVVGAGCALATLLALTPLVSDAVPTRGKEDWASDEE